MQTPDWLANAGNANTNFATSLLQGNGFNWYGGQYVAPFSGQQQTSFDQGDTLAKSILPQAGQAGSMLTTAGNAGPGSVHSSTIASNMSPYMNQYVSQALAPQLQMQQQQFDQQNKGFDAQATGAGAYGDTGWGLGRTNLTQQQDTARTGLVGNAYNAAFNTAIGAGAQDAANNMNAQTTNANLNETALNRKMAAANSLNTMGTGAVNLENQLGSQQSAAAQANNQAKYSEFLRSQQYPFQATQAVDQALAAGRQAAPLTMTNNTNTASTTNGTSTTSAPDNSGFGMIGSIGSNLLPLMFAADGGAVPAGRPTVVGERGPEVIVPGKNSVVIPNEVLRAAMAMREAKNNKSGPNLRFGLAA